MVDHSGQFERVKGLFSNVFDAGKTVDVFVTETPRANCRCRAEGDKGGDKAGSIRIHEDGAGGTVFNERTRCCASWRDDAERRLTREERQARNVQWAIQKEQKAERLRRENRETQFTASMILRESKPVVNHPYLTRKHITPTSTMFEVDATVVDSILMERGHRNDHGQPFKTGYRGRLLVTPLYEGSELKTLQFIDANGKKRYLHGGHHTGAYWLSRPFEVYQAECIGIAEGVATARSVELVQGIPCVAVTSCSNFLSVAQHFRDLFPNKNIVILADLGEGEEQAEKAGQAINALVKKPYFTEENVKAFKAITGSDKPTDWNDYCIATGRL